MSNTVNLTVLSGQQAIVLSTDGVLALQRWTRLRDTLLDMEDAGPDFANAALRMKDAANELALHVRAAVDVASSQPPTGPAAEYGNPHHADP